MIIDYMWLAENLHITTTQIKDTGMGQSLVFIFFHSFITMTS